MITAPRKKVMAAVIEQNGLFMLAQRGKHDSLYGKWEFPGGKIEGNETEQECLARELHEEFGIQATIGDYLCSVDFTIKDKDYQLRAYHVPAFTGKITLTEHLDMHWVSLTKLSEYQVPEADIPVVKHLQTVFKANS